jgi:integrase/recombinase XerD
VITHWLKNHNLRQVQQMAGHRYISSTEAYLVNQTEDLQADIDQFHPF